jgi:hypothetical protein
MLVTNARGWGWATRRRVGSVPCRRIEGDIETPPERCSVGAVFWGRPRSPGVDRHDHPSAGSAADWMTDGPASVSSLDSTSRASTPDSTRLTTSAGALSRSGGITRWAGSRAIATRARGAGHGPPARRRARPSGMRTSRVFLLAVAHCVRRRTVTWCAETPGDPTRPSKWSPACPPRFHSESTAAEVLGRAQS